ncbi:MAG: hypothetical protein FCPL1_gp1 [Hangzhou cletus punctiger lispivirus 1]|uniref:Nucleocapsid protein n=1 Tax=Hangzhou cletus punctiger lispivirus 1 TaxID=2905566 RepID=A0A8K1XCD6_9MONO|nr:MAG: hypothetical protein QKV05_gp1 [Hangzhou cletus punctiger lispivirus 1]UHK03159.1 MAG: hypothetical protein FCPL1_gp1 [Hangzhou cletus punctiger lispivirus 1]
MNVDFFKTFEDGSTLVRGTLRKKNPPGLISPNMLDDLLVSGQEVRKSIMKTGSKIADNFFEFKIALQDKEVSLVDFPSASVMDRLKAMMQVCTYMSLNENEVTILGRMFLTILPAMSSTRLSSWDRYYRKLGYTPKIIDLSRFMSSMDNLLGERGAVIMKDISQQYKGNLDQAAYAMMSVYLCLLGKTLTDANATQWGKACITAMVRSAGLNSNPEIESIYPTRQSSSLWNATINSNVTLRAGLFYMVKKISINDSSPDWLRNLMQAVLVRLSFSELLSFKLIDQYIMNGRVWLLLWGVISQRMYSVMDAYRVFNSFGEDAPYLKLITRSNATPQFNEENVKYVGEIARQIGILGGNLRLENINLGIELKKDSDIMNTIRDLLNSADNSAFTWSLSRANDIVRAQLNKDLIGRMVSGSRVEGTGSENTTLNATRE